MTGLRARPTFAVPVAAPNNRRSALGLELELERAALFFVIQHTSILLPTYPRRVCSSCLVAANRDFCKNVFA